MKIWSTLLGFELSTVSYKEKLVSAIGGIISILLLITITHEALHYSGAAAVIASMGASAVLLFAVPHGQLSQPWPVMAGHGFSALTGVVCYQLIPRPEVAAACAVGISIGLMHQLKCIHPPGGATALTAVLGGDAVHQLGFHFVWCPVLINAFMMVMLAILFNGFFKWRRYPAFFNRAAQYFKPPPAEATPSHEEIVQALKSLDSFVDITEEDLIRIWQILESAKHPAKNVHRSHSHVAPRSQH